MITSMGFIYVLYFLGLGTGMRVAFNLVSKNHLKVGSRLEFIAHAFFQGVFLHILLFNAFQFFNVSTSVLLSILACMVLAAIILTFWQIKQGIGVDSHPKKTKYSGIIIVILVIFASVLIYWNGYLLPNIAWDSWTVWEAKAEQWNIHGLHSEIVTWDQWIIQKDALFNQSANYPDGLSLIYYLPKLMTADKGFAVTHVVYLFGFAMMTLLLANRLAKYGTSLYLQFFMVLVIYTTPLISNHLMIQGYADIWLAMYILLIMLTLMDYKETGHHGVGLTLACYMAILPMLKLEGWVWLLLFILAYLFVRIWQSSHRYWFIGGALILLGIIVSGVIEFSLPIGDLIINHKQLVILNLINTPIQFVNITDQLLISFFWQNNWSVLWLGLPFLLVTFFTQHHGQATQVAQVFFISALLSFLFLFYFTEASKWALDLTAINRLVLQLTPCYLYLLFRMLTKVESLNPTNKKAQST